MADIFRKWIFFFFMTWLIGVLCLKYFSFGQPIEADLLMKPDQLLMKHNYPVEVHEVITDDGYILTLFRIPHGKNDTEVNAKPILMMHGMFGTAFNFVFTEYFNSSMAGYFADHGDDVWLGNSRGNTYSKKHVKLDPNNVNFWKFSWHDIGMHDLPATIDYVLNVTGKNNLYYIGHSQGGTIFYVLASLRPEYQKKFAQVSLLAPGGLMKHFNNSMVRAVSRNHRMLYSLAENMKIFEIPPPWLNSRDLLLNLCIDTLLENFCKGIFFISVGGDSGEFDSTIFPMLLNTLTSVSAIQALHYAQNIDSGKFRLWDYGEEKNMIVYGQAEPPDYPVEKIETPVAIYYGNKDNQAFAKDQREMCRRLKNCVSHMMTNPKWNHFDFLVSKNLEQELFAPLKKHMDSFELS